jgi:hypothetical protein
VSLLTRALTPSCGMGRSGVDEDVAAGTGSIVAAPLVLQQCRFWDNLGLGGDHRGDGSVVMAFSPFVVIMGDTVTVRASLRGNGQGMDAS